MEQGLDAVAAGGLAPLAAAAQQVLAAGVDVRAVVLVEGASDRAAVEAMARRRGRDLGAEGVAVLAMGGATNLGRFLDVFGPSGLDLELAGLCDEREVGDFRRGLARAGLGARLDRAGMEALGFFACRLDLEDELIRALGPAAVERVVDAEGELGSFRALQQQPAQRGRSTDEQLRRFLGSRGGRKIRYAGLLAAALDSGAVPLPLNRVLAAVRPR